MKRLAAATFVAVLVGGLATAGEVKGPPGQLNNTNETGAPTHANSACAFSGLNDMDTTDPEGQLVNQTQTAADAFKFYGLPHGVQGHGAPDLGIPGLCKGGSN